VVWPVERKWLDAALGGTEAASRGSGSFDVTLNKNGRQVIVQGRVSAPLVMPCARTLEPVEIDIDAELLLLLSPAPVPVQSPVSKRSKKRNANAAGSHASASSGQMAETGRSNKERVLSQEDAAQDFYSGDHIVLDGFLRESILLELPMVPLRSDLRAIENPAIPRPPDEANVGTGNWIDPRLAPLAEIAGRLKHDTKE
jgi:uncharacterized protein